MERAVQMTKACTGMEAKLADMLLAPEAAPAKVNAHVAECEACRAELEELRATMNLLDTWDAPEPSPYFMTRLHAKLDEERQAPRPGWLARLRARVVYGPSMHVRPLAAMALTVLMLVGGGVYLNLTGWDTHPAVQSEAAVVNDLQTLDNNAQLLDQLEAISYNDTDTN